MSELSFSVLDIDVEPYAAVPSLRARLRVEDVSGRPVHAIALRCQLRIEPQRRDYRGDDEAGLLDLFGPRERWAQTMKPFLWMHTTTMVQGFSGSCEVELPLACTYDFDVAAVKYLSALGNGEIPLVFLFSGTVFDRGANGFGVRQIPWDNNVPYRLPVAVWRELIDQHFPNSGWIRMRRDTLDALVRLRAAHGLTSWDELFELMLATCGADLSEPGVRL
jgi:hypothetical protein